MHATAFRWSINVLTIGCIGMIALIFTGYQISQLTELAVFQAAEWQNLKTVFISIFLEALPFILLGVIVSSAIHLYVSEDTLRRVIPRNPILAVTVACLLGILLPVCECGMIPIVRRLIGKGMPVYVGITYILAAPIINPVTWFATYMAFRGQPEMAYYRMGMAFFVATTVGLILFVTVKKNPLRHANTHSHDHEHTHSHSHDHAHSHSHDHDHSHDSVKGRFLSIFSHASDEFFEMGKYLLLGAFLTATIQTFVSRGELVSVGGGLLGSHLLMMGFAYLISLCSSSDAFVAASFSGTFPKSALLTFLVFGPMIDFKNTLMMLAVFKSRFVLLITVLIAGVVLIASVVFQTTLLH